MTKAQQLYQQLTQRLASQLQQHRLERGEVTIEVAPTDYLAVCKSLRDDADFAFEIMIDLCGVDYLNYGKDEWNTNATGSGFSRGYEPVTHGRLRFGDDVEHADEQGQRFAAVMHLLSIKNNQRIRVRVYAEDDAMPVVPSVSKLWNGANWFEREAFDLYGIHFEGHPDLRRILTDYGFVGHPFRKDFPLSGHVEMRYDPQKKRVLYEPVSIEPRVLVPKVIRDDNRYQLPQDED